MLGTLLLLENIIYYSGFSFLIQITVCYPSNNRLADLAPIKGGRTIDWADILNANREKCLSEFEG